MGWWDIQTYDSGIPRETEWDRALRVLQPVLVIFFAAMMVLTLPASSHPWGTPLQLVLVVVCAGLLLTVPVPDRIIDLRTRLILASITAVLAGVLMGLGGQGWPATFSYMIALHAAIRFVPRVAVWVIALNVGVAIGVQLLWGPADITPWWTNLLVFLSIIPGMARYTRQETFAAADEVVRQTRKAAESEAQSRALADRAAIARDIHDVLAHSLSGVNMQLSLADALFDADRVDEGRAAVRNARTMVVTGLEEARSAVQMLRGDTVDPAIAIAGMLTGPHETLTVRGEPLPMDGRTVHTMVRIAQESVTNARRHAPDARLDCVLEFGATPVEFTATNKAGHESSSAGSGLGLVGMRERAAAIGAHLEAGPLPPDDPSWPGGWRVHLSIPTTGIDDEEQP
ncbi:histidine kinase [Gordonia sp. CPCC 205515]|uniref:sensor histidine kinase n=1 Tax=Gordonia sp. CPCC 205515 TaxID=3140791 RepID=UPI003AF3D092